MLNFIGNILLFLLSLCVLICLHELGHLLMAKVFKVFCYEYSIGMGPLIFKYKPKGKETQFSIRCFPVGGYVAMAGDEEDDKDHTNAEVAAIPKERTIAGIKWWKQIIIFIAGVTVNFILGFLFFFVSYTCCPQYNYRSNSVAVLADSKLITDGTTSLTIAKGDKIVIEGLEQKVIINGEEKWVTVPEHSSYYFSTDSYTDISDALNYASVKSDLFDYRPMSEDDVRTIKFYIIDKEGTHGTLMVTTKAVAGKKDKMGAVQYAWDTIGFSVTTHYLGFVEGTKTAFIKWGEGTVALIKVVGMLFTPQGWANTGGIISVFRLSEQAVSLGAGVFFSYWGLISVNLAIFNLLPVPGLDGWQIVVAAFEGITKKKIPSKAKTIVSYIGLGLLLILMVVLIVKDIIMIV